MKRWTKRTISMMVVLGALALASGRSEAENVKLNLALSSPVMLAGSNQTVYIKVGLAGDDMPVPERRTPVNVALVLDRSGSMQGDKLWKVKDAAKMAIGRLSADDIVSIVAYNHSVDVLVPATKIADRYEIYNAIDRLEASGNTALFAGVSKGASEVRKFVDDRRVNRVILLSDGLANVGPSSTPELADLGYSLSKEGISITTIGLGGDYNEDLMVALARASDGNHAFAETAGDLSRIFNFEFGDLLSVVARDLIIEIDLGPGVRPIRVLGRDAEIQGHRVYAKLGQIYARQEKYILIEAEVPPSPEGSSREAASVRLRYSDTISRKVETRTSRADISFTASPSRVEESRNKDVMVSSIELKANEETDRAIRLRDQGRTEEAKQVLHQNAQALGAAAATYGSGRLDNLSKSNKDDADEVEGSRWNVRRKTMRKREYELDQQQPW